MLSNCQLIDQGKFFCGKSHRNDLRRCSATTGTPATALAEHVNVVSSSGFICPSSNLFLSDWNAVDRFFHGNNV